MTQVLWLALAWIAGTAAILGTLMTLGSVLLWMVPSAPSRSRRPTAQRPTEIPPWQNRLKLFGFSAAIALAGLGILVVVPFPYF